MKAWMAGTGPAMTNANFKQSKPACRGTTSVPRIIDPIHGPIVASYDSNDLFFSLTLITHLTKWVLAPRANVGCFSPSLSSAPAAWSLAVGRSSTVGDLLRLPGDASVHHFHRRGRVVRRSNDEAPRSATYCASPVSNGVIRRTVTRRFARSGPSVWIFRYCSPYPWVDRFSAGTANCWVSAIAADSARRSESDRLSTSEPTASV